MTSAPLNDAVHVVARAVADDPHTLAVLALAGVLREAKPAEGATATVFAADGADMVDGIEPLAQLSVERTPRLVYHQQDGAPALVRRLTELGPLLAVVHGEPAPDPLALRDLRMLAAAGAVGLATSDRAAARLRAAGFERVSRVPTVVARERLAAVNAFAPTMNHLDVALHGPLILTVNDVATAADPARVVQAFHVLRTYLSHSGQSHLAIAVPDSAATSEAAVQTLYREVWGLRLTDAWAHRLVNPGERAALTRRANVFVTTDPASGDVRHALAAMAEGVAVVATADANAAEVLGDGALLLPPDAGAALVAEALAELLRNEPRRVQLAAAGTRAVVRFDAAAGAPAWRAALAA